MPTTTITCIDCNELSTEYSLIHGEAVCYACRDDNYGECAGCGELYYSDDLVNCEHDNLYCSHCYCTCNADENDETVFRKTDETTNEYIGRRQGRMVKSLRPFGVEIECYLETESKRDVLDELPQAVGIGPDGSLGRDGIEVRTPRLAGAKGEALIRCITNRLEKYRARVNRSCGLHVHLDTSDTVSTDVPHLRLLWALYLAFEDVLLSFLPPSRRGNRYCKTLRRFFHAEEILTARTREELEAIWYRAHDNEEVKKLKQIKGHDSRYIGLNLHSLFHAGHAEIRYHSGTVNADKILQWVNLHARLFDKAKGAETILAVEAALDEVSMARKTSLLFAFLELPETARQYFLQRQALFNHANTERN